VAWLLAKSYAIEAGYEVRGCTASIAAGSALTDWIVGRPAADLPTFRPAIMDEAVGGLAPESKHAAVLCADAVKALCRAQTQSR
jgi:nitrogen fixation NifU-like protein